MKSMKLKTMLFKKMPKITVNIAKAISCLLTLQSTISKQNMLKIVQDQLWQNCKLMNKKLMEESKNFLVNVIKIKNYLVNLSKIKEDFLN